MAIKDWPADERPREKPLAKGAEALSDAELMAILLRSGYAKQTAVDPARQLLTVCGGVAGLRQIRLDDFSNIKGLGISHFAAIQAGIALANRALLCPLKHRHAVNHSAATRAYLLSQLNFEVKEVFWGLFFRQPIPCHCQRSFVLWLSQSSLRLPSRGAQCLPASSRSGINYRSQPSLWRTRAQPSRYRPYFATASGFSFN